MNRWNLENMSYNREDREMFDAKCGDCGTDCQVPFQPKQDRPVYCRECFQNHKPEPRNRDRFGGRQGGRFGRRDERPREMHDAKCGDCGNDCQVPFQPKQDRPVYCRECFQNHKPEPRNRDRFGGRQGGRFGRRDERPREMHDAKCGDCGNDCQVPFQPKEDRPVYCRDCFQNHR